MLDTVLIDFFKKVINGVKYYLVGSKIIIWFGDYKMDEKALNRFLNQEIQLKKKDTDFVLRGVIKEFFSDSILFLTDGKLRVIDFSEITEVREVTNGRQP